MFLHALLCLAYVDQGAFSGVQTAPPHILQHKLEAIRLVRKEMAKDQPITDSLLGTIMCLSTLDVRSSDS